MEFTHLAHLRVIKRNETISTLQGHCDARWVSKDNRWEMEAETPLDKRPPTNRRMGSLRWGDMSPGIPPRSGF